MTTFCPGVEHCEEHCPEFAEGDVADDISVVSRPARDLRIESLDQLRLFLRDVSLYRLPQFLGVPFDRLRTWLDSCGTPDCLPMTISIRVILPSRILPDPETQKFKARFTLRQFQRMSDPGFVLIEFQPHLTEPFLDDLQALLDHFSLMIVSSPCKAMLASNGEMPPPCGVPAVVENNSSPSITPASSHPLITRPSFGLVLSFANNTARSIRSKHLARSASKTHLGF